MRKKVKYFPTKNALNIKDSSKELRYRKILRHIGFLLLISCIIFSFCINPYFSAIISNWNSLVAQTVKNLPAMQEIWFHPWVGKIRQRKEWQPTPVFLAGKFHGQRGLESYSPWGHKELDMTKQLTLSLSSVIIINVN